jgi:cell fate regulator YaaT (PSP1 superfamily)
MVVKVFLDDREREQFYEAGDLPLRLGARVVVEHAERLRVGKVIAKAPYFPRHKLKIPLKPVLRLATPDDVERTRGVTVREDEACQVAARVVAERNLPMKIVHVRSSGNGNRLTVLYTAEERVDFRDLVRDLAQRLRARIEMKHIGVRDEAAITGAGVGS